MKIVAAAFFVLLSVAAVAEKDDLNIIYIIVDGMGAAHVSAYRHFADNPATARVEPTLFDDWHTGMASTHPANPREITDSAAGATALSSGIKTYNGAIGMDSQHQPQETLLERVRKSGYRTGLVATSQINHATPASFAAHTQSRSNYDEIADQYFDNRFAGRPFMDLIIGGGRRYFVREDRNLVEEFQAEGWHYAETLNALQKIDSLPALALLADVGMPYAIDSDAPHLAPMTEKALELISSDSPFFLLVEGSLVDWCGHANDIACAMREMADTEAALAVVRDFADRTPNTLVVVTADHGTGGLSMGRDGGYWWNPDVIRNVQHSAPVLAQRLVETESNNWAELWRQSTGITLSTATHSRWQNLVQQAKNDGETARLEAEIKSLIDQLSNTGWTTTGHTGGDVVVMAYGKNRSQFQGHLDNTEIAQKLFELLPKKR